VVSTDSQEIAEIARDQGAEVPFIRPSELAQDHSPEWLVWQHAIRALEKGHDFMTDYLVVLPPTSPFRSEDDIRRSLELIRETDTDIVISVTDSGRNPYFNMVEPDQKGFAHLSKVPEQRVFRRQDAPRVYDMTTVIYTTRRDFVLKADGVFDGRVKAMKVPETRALDIDTEMDFRFAEFLIREGVVKSYEKDIRTH
jgi:N-acylneuraminate cytidylyltransferase